MANQNFLVVCCDGGGIRGLITALLLQDLEEQFEIVSKTDLWAGTTGAAPMYFPPHKLPDIGYCVDGGLFANNPCTLALAKLVQSGILAAEGKTIDDIRMLSLGTGLNPEGIPQPDGFNPFGTGAMFWLLPVASAPTPKFPLISAMFDASSQVNTLQCTEILGRPAEHEQTQFQRANVTLNRPIPLDDYTDVPELKNITRTYLAGSEWNEVKNWVRENFV